MENAKGVKTPQAGPDRGEDALRVAMLVPPERLVDLDGHQLRARGDGTARQQAGPQGLRVQQVRGAGRQQRIGAQQAERAARHPHRSLQHRA